ncbi:peptidyl-Lys metalloendopeptidase [Rhizoctonia solani]|uniref:Peptidyl-Lys metalloendopeptidase n=1 Tax=Rhizoctonia solani TaxID=456999 RepID=A0A8H7M6N7_9AGAM|nr:peptidyl-Lys metalloendopeptidase [Rhizoctonia solani]
MKSAISAALLSAITVSAAPGLVLDVTAPPSAVDVDGLTVKAVLKNTGTESLKLLNDPRTVLSKAPTDTFSITSDANTQTPKFTGIKLKYVPATAAAKARDADFTVLAPGQSIEIDHALAGFAANNVFNYVDASGELKTIEASSNSNRFKLAGKLVAPSTNPKTRARSISKRVVSYAGCSSSQQSLVSAAATASNTYVANVNTYLNGISSGTTRYTTWFGAYTAARLSTVRSHYTSIGTDATSTTYDCTTCQNTSGIDYDSTYAYVYSDEPGTIYLCGVFWDAPVTGTDSRAGTIVHENSHFEVNGGTSDWVYGQSSAKSLATSNPTRAIDNADNHEYLRKEFEELEPPSIDAQPSRRLSERTTVYMSDEFRQSPAVNTNNRTRLAPQWKAQVRKAFANESNSSSFSSLGLE